jgi:hypothetical protein
VFGYQTPASAANSIRDSGYVGPDKLARAEQWFAKEKEKDAERERLAKEATSLPEAVATRRVYANGAAKVPEEPPAAEEPQVAEAPAEEPEHRHEPQRVTRRARRAEEDSFEAIRADAMKLAERIQAMGELLPKGLPKAMITEMRAAIQKRADKLLTFIAEELEE